MIRLFISLIRVQSFPAQKINPIQSVKVKHCVFNASVIRSGVEVSGVRELNSSQKSRLMIDYGYGKEEIV